jgi:hypothetical protein
MSTLVASTRRLEIAFVGYSLLSLLSRPNGKWPHSSPLGSESAAAAAAENTIARPMLLQLLLAIVLRDTSDFTLTPH